MSDNMGEISHVTLTKLSQSQKDKYCMIPLDGESKIGQLREAESGMEMGSCESMGTKLHFCPVSEF